jgi:hypothetical protein
MAHNPKTRKRHFATYGYLKTEYESNFKPTHTDINDYIYPYGANLSNENNQTPNDGSRRDENIINATATMALRTFRSGMYNSTANPTDPWFKMTIDDKDLREVAEVQEYFDKVTNQILADLAKSNFYTSTEAMYGQLGAFGTGCMQVDANVKTVFNFTTYTIGNYYIDTGEDNKVNAVYREFPMRAKNVVAQFGEDNVSDKVKELVKPGKTGSDWVKILHIQEPNVDRDSSRLDSQNKEYLSTYYEVSGDDDTPALRVSGYNSQPFAAPRFSVSGSNTWGEGPGMDAIGYAKELQQLELDYLEALAKQVDPALVVNAAAGSLMVDSTAGGLTWTSGVEDGTRPVVSNMTDSTVNLENIRLKILDVEQSIKTAFFADLFQIFPQTRSRQPETATEVIEKKKEQLGLLAPASERLHPDFLRPVLDRCFELEQNAGRLPDPPDIIQGLDIKIEITSQLAQAQKLAVVNPIQQVVAGTAQLVEVWPDARYKINAEQVVDELANAFSVPSSIINSDEEVLRLKAADQAAQQALQAQETAQGAVSSAKQLSETDVSGDNALTALLGAA